ncbi:hypothetical protein Tco_0862858 [Tanacetum coccineum]
MVAFLKKPEGSAGFHQIVDFLNSTHIKYALTENPIIYVSLILQFWQTASASTSENGDMEITATINGRVKTVTEASIRRYLKLEDSDGISTLPNTKNFEQLALMGYGEGSTVPVESHHTPTDALSTSPLHISPTLRSPIRQETEVPQLSSPAHTNVADEAASTSHTLGSDEGRMQQHELMDLVTKLSDRCEDLETDLWQTKKVYIDALTRLIKNVKKLEKTVKTSQARRRSRVILSDNEVELEDSSKQGRSMIEEIDQDTGITLVQINVKDQVTPIKLRREVSTGSGEISTAEEPASTAGESMPVSTAGMVQEAITPSSVATKDKGKAIMQESESPKKMKQREQIQISRDEEVALKLQEEFDATERQRIARVHEEASSFNIEEWEDIQATIEADEELAQRIQAKRKLL